MQPLPLRALAALTVLHLFGACVASRASDPIVSGSDARWYEGLGEYSRPVTTRSAQAQRWFDQGLMWLYAFNGEEAVRSFARAAELDPDCAMAHWGVALALEGLLDHPEQGRAAIGAAHAAAQAALARLDEETPAERALAHAIARRRAPTPQADRAALDHDYAAAMEAAFQAHPQDPDVGAFYAESLMALQPWSLWTPRGEPEGRALEIVGVLEDVIGLHPRHPGANHFLIHALEASSEPERASGAAEVLADLAPGAGHLVHMPSHVWIRTGRYARALEINRRAIAADEAYLALAPEPELYGVFPLHNLHFLAFAAMMSGDRATALEAAERLERALKPEFARRHARIVDGLSMLELHVRLRFGDWEEVLLVPEPSELHLGARALRLYARSVALANLERTREARTEQSRFEAAAARVDDGWIFGSNLAPHVLAVARETIQGEILFREGERERAFEHLRRAVALEDELVYDEPPGWMQPARHALGALLLASGQAQEAESVFLRDLRSHPENVWSLIGLAGALRALERDSADVEARLARAWLGAQPPPAFACACAAGTTAPAR